MNKMAFLEGYMQKNSFFIMFPVRTRPYRWNPETGEKEYLTREEGKAYWKNKDQQAKLMKIKRKQLKQTEREQKKLERAEEKK